MQRLCDFVGESGAGEITDVASVRGWSTELYRDETGAVGNENGGGGVVEELFFRAGRRHASKVRGCKTGSESG